MKILFSHLSLYFVVAFLPSCSPRVVSPLDLRPGKVAVTIPESSQWTLDNGLNVVFKRIPNMSIIESSLYIPKGRSSGNCGTPALASITLDQMREGGTVRYEPDNLDKFLDSRAASIETSFQEDLSMVSMRALSEDFRDVFSVFAEVIQSPRFDPSRLALSKKLTLDGLLRRKDSPHAIARLTYSFALYGDGSPWYMPTTKKSISEISRDKLLQYHDFLSRPEGAYLLIVGSISEAEARELVQQNFSNWSGKDSSCRIPEMKSPKSESAIYLVQKPLQQASIIMGGLTPTVSAMPLYSMALFNRVFGSGAFDTILFEEVRTKRGLAYGVSGGFSAEKKRGQFAIQLASAAPRAIEAVSAVNEILLKLNKELLPVEKVEAAKDASLRSYVFKFENPAFAVSRPLLLDLMGYPATYDLEYQTRLSELDANSTSEVFRENFDIGNINYVIVGDVYLSDVVSLGRSVGVKKVCLISFDEVPVIKECESIN